MLDAAYMDQKHQLILTVNLPYLNITFYKNMRLINKQT